MNVKEEYFYDCEALLKYLYSKTKEEIECETALANEDKAVTKDAIRYWKQLERRCKKARIETLNDNHLASIALFEDVESLCAKVEHGNSTPNAKRVFNMLISDSEKLRVYISDENNDTPLEKYMKGVLNVTLAPRTKHTYINYQPGRSVDLLMLCDFGKDLNASYKKSGILEGLKALVGLKLVEAFMVTKKADGQIKTEQLKKEDITDNESILYKLSIKGCAEYIKNNA